MQFASCGYGKIVLWKHDGTIADVKFGPAGDPSKAESSQLVYNDLAWNSESASTRNPVLHVFKYLNVNCVLCRQGFGCG